MNEDSVALSRHKDHGWSISFRTNLRKHHRRQVRAQGWRQACSLAAASLSDNNNALGRALGNATCQVIPVSLAHGSETLVLCDVCVCVLLCWLTTYFVLLSAQRLFAFFSSLVCAGKLVLAPTEACWSLPSAPFSNTVSVLQVCTNSLDH
jgi:hypothetical protein